MALRLDHGKVPPAAFDAEDIDHVTEEIGQARLHRCIAAAMHDERGHAAEQAGGIGAERQIFADAQRGITLHAGACIIV